MVKTIFHGVLTLPKLIAGMLLKAYGFGGKRGIVTLKGTNVRIKADMATRYGRDLIKYGQRPSEPFLIPLMKRILMPGDIFVDIGAHWGTYSMVACALVGENGKVLAVEPFKRSCKIILKNKDLNNFNNLTLVNKALPF